MEVQSAAPPLTCELSSVHMADRAHTTVDVVPYDPEWPSRFAASAAEIRAVLPDAVIEHVGSTSVPGLSSKDTIDLAVGVSDVDEALSPETLDAFETAGFVHVPASFAADPDHAFLHRIVHDHRTDHVHVMRLGSAPFEGHQLFRDYLRAEPEAAGRYEAVKLDLARRFADHRSAYVDEKQKIVDHLMVEARAWRRRK